MKSYQRLGLIILISLLLSCLISPVADFVLQFLRGLSPGMHRALDFPFDRVMRRVVLVVTILLFYIARAKLEIVSLASIGMRREPGWRSLLGRGWILGTCSLALMLFIMVLFGSRRPETSFSGAWDLARQLVIAFLAGAVVGFIEEPFFRGFILQSLFKNLRRSTAVVSMSLFFAIVHFFNASDMPASHGSHPLLGFKALAYFFQPLLSPSEVIPGFIGLFLVSIVLTYAYLRTGSLYLSIGLHAGWVFGIKAESLFFDRMNHFAPWFFGDGRVVTGVFGWIMLLLMLLVVRCFIPRGTTPPLPQSVRD
ncbi:MAG: CPBP family intramembrane metalloprotease [Candidatus Aureabacteria bacterium]|nr:CPBP family intramembrane metalloprotease [Candidatus Auribacterota bacterium]